MLFDPSNAAEFLRQRATSYTPPTPRGAPAAECARSPAASRVAQLAHAAGLGLFHYEHRHHLPLPEDWLPDHADPAPPAWGAGVLEERKYQGFRHDQALGSFHPGHRAKWTVHELCHGLVGFAYRPDATPLFHALAGRLAELVPVTLWYFLDEVYVRRCPRHHGGGALFRTHCAACENASPSPEDPWAIERLTDGARYLDRELAASVRSRRTGRVWSHRYATLDLSSDGVAYAHGHGGRLASPAMRRFVEDFCLPGQGVEATLVDLEERVATTAKALVDPSAPPPDLPDGEEGWRRWVVQDVAWRLLSVRHETEGEAAVELDRLIDDLAARGAVALGDLVAAYAALAEDYYIPEPDELFAVGYPLLDAHPGWSADSLTRGLASGLPHTVRAAGDDLPRRIEHLVTADRRDPSRTALPRRAMEAWHDEGPMGALCRYEAAVATLPPPRLEERVLGPGQAPLVLATHARVLTNDYDALALADHFDPAAPPARQHLVLWTDDDGDVGIAEISDGTAVALAAGDQIDEPERTALAQLGVLIPSRWPVTTPRG